MRWEDHRRAGQRRESSIGAIDTDRSEARPPRISLSIKRLADDPWERFIRCVQVGQTLQATLTLADQSVADPSEVVRVGEVLPVTAASVVGNVYICLLERIIGTRCRPYGYCV